MLKDYFEKVTIAKITDKEQRYVVSTDKCVATIYITRYKVNLAFITSMAPGGGSDMLDKLEKYSKQKNKVFTVSNIVNPKLETMLVKRGYMKSQKPAFKDENETIYEDVYIYAE